MNKIQNTSHKYHPHMHIKQKEIIKHEENSKHIPQISPTHAHKTKRNNKTWIKFKTHPTNITHTCT